MATTYPAAYDTFTDPLATDLLDSSTVGHASQHTHVNDAVEAVQHFIGRAGVMDSTTVEGRLNTTKNGLAAHLASSTAHPAANITFTPVTGITQTDVQAALAHVWSNLDGRVATLESGGPGPGTFTTISVLGAASIDHLNVANDSTFNNVTVGGYLHANGSGYSLQAANKVAVGNDIEVTGTVKALAALTVATTATITGALASGPATVTGTLGVSSNATVGGTLAVTGATTLAALNAASVAASGAVSGASGSFTNTLTVGGIAPLLPNDLLLDMMGVY